MKQSQHIEIQIDSRWAEEVDVTRIQRAIVTTLKLDPESAQLNDSTLSFVIVGDEEITRLHESYRAESGTTDVLTFPYEEDALVEEMRGYLGDIIVCYPQAARQGGAEGHSVQDELDLLAVHGTLHLLGYDDETPAEKKSMWRQQRQVMAQLGLPHVAP
ncbi:MAG: rRNA maturation RNase YbeY [Ardenticatenaceae bacterium]